MNRKKVLQKLGITSLFALVFVAGLIVSPMIGQLAFPKTVGRLQVEIYPKNATLFKGEIETFYAMVYNGSGNYQYEWSVNGSITWHEALYDFSFSEPCKIVILSVFVRDSEGNTGYASEIVYDPIATGSYYLDVPLPIADYHIGQFSNSSSFAVNGSNWDCFLVSSDHDYVFRMVSGNLTTGGKITVGSGIYTISGGTIPLHSSQTWEGSATPSSDDQTKGTVLQQSGNLTGGIFNANSQVRMVKIRNLALVGDMGGTIKEGMGINGTFQEVYFEDCFIAYFPEYGIRAQGTLIHVEGNRFGYSGTTTTGASCYLGQIGQTYGADDSWFIDNYVSGYKGTADWSCGSKGLDMHATMSRVMGNHFAYCTTAILVTSGRQIIQIADNEIETYKEYGIKADAQPHSFSIHDNTISGNNPSGTPTAGIYFAGYDGGEAYNSTIHDNVIMGNTYGIHLKYFENVTVHHNVIEDAVTTAIFQENDGGGNLIHHNRGWVTENSGFTTIKNMENVTHGLVETPTYLQITALNATYDTKPFNVWANITAFDSTYFGVTAYWFNGTAISDDVLYICWEARTWN